MSWYKTGSIAATNGSRIITGAGTQFTNPLNSVSAGRMLLLPGSGTVQIYEIESVQSDTQLTLVSAFTGTAGSGKSYAIPTSPTVSIEQFAHEFASTLAYYQQQLQGWQSILTGTGNITLTTPDGQSVTVRSQAEWDRLLNTKMGAGQFGWGGNAKTVTGNLGDYFGTNGAPSGLYQCDSSQVTGLPDGFGPSILEWHYPSVGYGILYAADVTSRGKYSVQLLRGGEWQGWDTDWNSHNLSPATTNTNQTINAVKNFQAEWASLVISPETVGGASYIQGNDFNGAGRFILGALDPNSNVISLRNLNGSASVNVLPNRTIDLFCDVINTTGAKGFVRNAQGSPGFSGIGDIQQSWRREQRMGSVLDTSNSRWRSFINVLHRGGNDNQEVSGGDSGDWGFVFVDDNMTSTAHNFRIVKLRAGVFGPGVDLYHTGNATADANGYLKVASPIVKLFADGSSELNAESEGIVTTRLSEGVYHITGCLGLNADRAWGGEDGGITNPRCRNGYERIWNDYDVQEDGSLIIRTYHRVHS
ncbi:hypothetical protein KU75_22930, partial [Pectobacterium odoriferum]